MVSIERKVSGQNEERDENNRKKRSWHSRGDYTTGVNDTFACCRSDMDSVISPLEFYR
jgi:hypothetical protein